MDRDRGRCPHLEGERHQDSDRDQEGKNEPQYSKAVMAYSFYGYCAERRNCLWELPLYMPRLSGIVALSESNELGALNKSGV